MEQKKITFDLKPYQKQHIAFDTTNTKIVLSQQDLGGLLKEIDDKDIEISSIMYVKSDYTELCIPFPFSKDIYLKPYRTHQKN